MVDINLLFAGVPVSNFEIGRSFYEQFFGRKADVAVHNHEDMWHLGEGAFLYVLADAKRAGGSLVTMSVGDLDQVIAEIESRGIKIESVETVGEAGRKATVFDPDGNSIAIIELLET